MELRDKLGADRARAGRRRPARRAPRPQTIRTWRRAMRSSALGFAVPEAEAALAGSQGTTEQRVKQGLAAAAARRPVVSEDERLVGAEAARADEDETDRSLRPRQLDEFVGQEVVREQLAIALAAAKERGEPIDHVLLAGPPGLGKSTLAHIVASEMETRLVTVSGPGLDRKGDLVAILADLGDRDVVFIDEVHRLNRAVEETLYPAMEDGVVDIIMGQGPGARSLRLDLAPFTLIGATTRASLLTKPLARPLRAGLPARSLLAGGARAHRAALGGHPRHRHAGRRRGGAGATRSRHAASGQPAAAARARLRPGARRRFHRPCHRGVGARSAGRGRRGARPARPRAPADDRGDVRGRTRSGSPRWPMRSARTAARSRTSTSRICCRRACCSARRAVASSHGSGVPTSGTRTRRPGTITASSASRRARLPAAPAASPRVRPWQRSRPGPPRPRCSARPPVQLRAGVHRRPS